MGLFSKKEPCAICGGKVSALFPWKIGGHLICNLCHGQTHLPNGVEENMTLEEFQAYCRFREENQLLKQQFQVTDQVDFGWLDDKFLFDRNNGLLCFDKNLNTTIFEAGQIKSFVIREDHNPLFEGRAAGLICHTSTVPDRVMAMAPQINQIRMQEQMQRNTERLIDLLDGDDDNNRRSTYHYRMDIPEPFHSFHVEIYLDHPYWTLYTAETGGPTFSDSHPDVNSYLRDYTNKVATLEQLARALMALAFPDAPEMTVGSSTAAPAGAGVVSNPTVAVDAVAEIQRFKALVDQGILTEEEFAAKKRQLLGI